MHPLVQLGVAITAIWLVVLALQYIVTSRKIQGLSTLPINRRSDDLPLPSSSAASVSSRQEKWTPANSPYIRTGWSANLDIQLRPFYFLVSYNAASAPARSASLSPASRQSHLKSVPDTLSRSQYFASICYSIGGLIVLLTFTVILPLYLLATPVQLVGRIWASSPSLPSSAQASAPASATLLDDSPPGLVIPGITVPARDALATFLAGAFAIAWHEAGHGFAAALNGADITSVAFFLIYAFPGAYVALDTASFEALASAASKLSIITAGIWHNIVLCLAIWSALSHGIVTRNSGVYGWFGFVDLNEQGVVVQLVDQDSPLAGLLVPGQLITALDDVELHDSHIYKHWDRYLSLSESANTDSRSTYESLGWCVDRQSFESQPGICCAFAGDAQPTASATRELCFKPALLSEVPLAPDDGALGHCVDPAEILRNKRCTDTCASEDQVCVRPAPAVQLLRITVRDLREAKQETVFFTGPKARAWKNVKVGRYLAPGSWLQALPVDIEVFWKYTYGTSYGIALFNMLPLPKLDGDELLSCILDAHSSQPLLPTAASKKGLAHGRASDQEGHTWPFVLLASCLARVSAVLSRLLGLKDASAKKHLLVRRGLQVGSVVLVVVSIASASV